MDGSVDHLVVTDADPVILTYFGRGIAFSSTNVWNYAQDNFI